MKKRIAKIIIYTLIASVFVIIFSRWFLSVPRGNMKNMTFTEETEQAYLDNGGVLNVNRQVLQSYISSSGILQVRNIYYVAESEELQMTLYYNTFSLSDDQKNLWGMTDEDPFPFQMRLVDDQKKENTDCRIEFTKKVGMYRFARVIFHQVTHKDITSLTLLLTKEEQTLDSLLVYHKDMDFPEYQYKLHVPKALKKEMKA